MYQKGKCKAQKCKRKAGKQKKRSAEGQTLEQFQSTGMEDKKKNDQMIFCFQFYVINKASKQITEKFGDTFHHDFLGEKNSGFFKQVLLIFI